MSKITISEHGGGISADRNNLDTSHEISQKSTSDGGGAELSHVETSSTRLHKATRPNRKETRRVEEEDTQQKRWRASEDNEDVNPSALHASRPTGGANPQHEGKTSTLGNRFRKNCGRRRASPRVKTIEASVRDSDVAAHFGGDETQP
jgi:hypothetical protein